MISAGHWTALSLSRIECLKLCIVHPSGTYCFSHLFKAALAELAAVGDVLLYLGKAKSDALSASDMRLAAHKASPTKGILRSLLAVFRLRHGCLVTRTYGTSIQTNEVLLE